ncbi:MAG TPA: hypothetical protein VGE63_03450 [Candidatus Paceibacterota bacterium]
MRNQYIGKWKECGWQEINLDFNVENLKLLLKEGLIVSGEYTHQDIAQWCNQYTMYFIEREIREEGCGVAEDVSMQWDLFLTNKYSLEELQSLDFSKVRLPSEWFEEWIKELEK